MFTRPAALRKTAARLSLLAAALWLSACANMPLPGAGGSGPAIDPSRPVRIALLVPSGSGQATDAHLATNFENAARLAAADLQGARIDLAVYSTGANPAQAAAAATQAANDGAKLIVGPLYSEAANAAGVAVAPRGLNVLSFSNTPTIAGGNVFVMGNLFDSTAQRLVRYAASQGIRKFYIARADDLQGNLGAAAAQRAIAAAGGQVVGSHAYPLSQQDVIVASDTIARQAQAAGAQGVILTANVGAELAILGTSLPQNGLDPASTRMIGLTRWNAAPEMLDLPGLQGGLFALPDTARQSAFERRYEAAYGEKPHPLAGLAYDAIAAAGALIATGDSAALTRGGLTRAQGFEGTGGIFRFTRDGLNQKGLSVATIEGGATRILSPAPRSFSNAVY